MLPKKSFRNQTLSALTFGTMALTPLYNPAPDLSLVDAALQAGLDAGMDTLHTAHHYGEGSAFRIIRRVLARNHWQRHIKIVAKIDGEPSRLMSGKEGIEPTRHALDRDVIDMVQLVESGQEFTQRVNPDSIIADIHSQGPLFDVVNKLKQDGLIKQIGLEIYTPEQLQNCLKTDFWDFVVSDQSIIRQTAFQTESVAELQKRNMGLLAIRPLAGGWLTPGYKTLDDFAPGDNRAEWYWPGQEYRKKVDEICRQEGIPILEAAIRFLAGQSFVTSIVPGMRTPQQVEDILKAFGKGPLHDELHRQLDTLFNQPVIL